MGEAQGDRVKLKFAQRALNEIERGKREWLARRDKNPELFESELAEALENIKAVPALGSPTDIVSRGQLDMIDLVAAFERADEGAVRETLSQRDKDPGRHLGVEADVEEGGAVPALIQWYRRLSQVGEGGPDETPPAAPVAPVLELGWGRVCAALVGLHWQAG